MGSIGRYIFRTTLGAFVAVMVSLTALIWVTQALREIELMTDQGQTALVFLQITALVIPNLVVLLAPVALLMATAYVLNKLGHGLRDHRDERLGHVALALVSTFSRSSRARLRVGGYSKFLCRAPESARLSQLVHGSTH